MIESQFCLLGEDRREFAVESALNLDGLRPSIFANHIKKSLGDSKFQYYDPLSFPLPSMKIVLFNVY